MPSQTSESAIEKAMTASSLEEQRSAPGLVFDFIGLPFQKYTVCEALNKQTALSLLPEWIEQNP